MKYTIKYSNGNSLVIDSSTINNDTSIPMVGTNNSDFGNIYWSDLLHLLENFASPFSPNKPSSGQTWYDNKNKQLNVYDGAKWNQIADKLPDLTNYVTNIDGKLSGPLKLLSANKTNSAATRKYVDSIKFKFKAESNSTMSYVVYDNDYTIINFIIYPDAGNISLVTLPFKMADINYSILLSVNSLEHEFNRQPHFNSYNKTINGFDVVCNKDYSSIACVVMGFKAK
jgi:hypothetical protein